MKPMPVSAMQAATCSGVSMMLAPSASSTSALPDFDDTPRRRAWRRAPGSRGDEHRGGRDVEGMRTVAAGADDVDECGDRVRRPSRRELAHHLRRRGDLADRLLLDAQPGR